VLKSEGGIKRKSLMKRIAYYLAAFAMAAGVLALTAPVSGHADEEAAPVYGIKLPAGYREWTLISVASVGAPLNDIRAKLGNDVAMKAFREGRIPFPDGTIIARLAWHQVASEDNNNAIRPFAEKQLPPEQVKKLLDGSFVAGSPTNVQFMVKDSTKYASTGGWGFAQFNNGKPADEATITTCFGCHAPAKDRDFVFTRYAP
jgi:cytochrome P460